MKSLLLFCVCAISLFNSCTSEIPINKLIVLGESDVQMEIIDYWKNATVITLIEDTTDVLGGVSQIRYKNGKYFVLNSEGTIIKQFDEAGQCLSIVNSQGNAHNEYISIGDFDVTDDSIYMCCYPNKILVADMSGKIKNVIDLDLELAGIACNDEYLYVYTQQDRGLYVYDNGTWENIFAEGNLPACPHDMNVFFKTDDELFYFPEGGDKMYEIDGKDARPLFTIDYPDKQKINERLKENKRLKGLEIARFAPLEVNSFVSTKDLYIMTYTYKAIARGCAIDKKELSLKQDGWWCGFMPNPVASSSDGCLASEFISRDDTPFDTTSIDINYKSTPNLDDGQLTIVKYLNK